MNPKLKLSLAITLGVALVLVALAAALGPVPRSSSIWTDDATIRVPDRGAPLREILWRQAEPLKSDTPIPTPSTTTTTDEYEPRFSADGTTLVFVKNRPGHNADLFTSKWTPAGWSEPTPIESINTDHDELGPELSRDGKALYFYSDREGGMGGYDIWVSASVDGAWGTPVNLGPTVNSRFNEYGPAISPTGNTLYFSSNRPRPGETAIPDDAWSATVREHRTRHDYDLYYARMEGGTPSMAISATALNTPADEGAPALSPAGDFVYFASDRQGGLGGFDLYRARIASTGEPGLPENLGPAINSTANDLDPALASDGFRLCFSSDRPLPSGAPNSPAANAPSAEISPRYSLWASVSREVYRSTEPRAAWAAWNLMPWVLLFIATALPILLLFYLLRSELWRKRFGRLGLIAQCLLLSLIIHAALASLLSIWHVGTGIINLMQHGGGNRVVLASDSPGGSVVDQIRGLAMTTSVTVPELSAITAPALESSADVRSIQTSLPELVAPPLAMPTLVDQARVERPASIPSTSIEPVSPPVAVTSLPATPRAEAAVSEASVAPTPINSAPSAAPTIASLIKAPSPVDLPRPAITGEQTPSRMDAPVAHRTGPDHSNMSPTTLAPQASAAPTDSSLPSIRSAEVPVQEPGTAPMTGLKSAGAIQAPTASGSPASAAPGRTDIPLAPMASGKGDQSAQPIAALAATPDRAAAPSLALTPAPTPTPSAASSSASSVGIPRVAAPTSAPASEASLSAAGPVGVPLVASPVGPAVAAAPGGGFVQIDPGAPSSLASSVGSSPLASPTTSADSSRIRAESPSLASTPLPGLSPGNGDARLPAEPPTPVETFSQRAPEVRADLLEKMGGSKETERAVALALDWFARHQDSDGHWSAQHFDDRCGHCNDAAEIKGDGAMTAMVLLCYLGAGHTHTTDGPYRDNVQRALSWLLARQDRVGDLRAGETMYSQTVAAVALCEALAMTHDPVLTRPTQDAVAFVLARAAGSQPKSDRDTSVLGWLVFTVESARRAGIDVPRATFDAAAKWLDYVAVPGSPGQYANSKGKPPTIAMTAEAMFVRQLLGHTRGEAMMEQSARFILRETPQWKEGAPTFCWYYATLALFQHQGDAWKQWNEALVKELLAHQEQSHEQAGSWGPQDEWSRMGGRVYQTAVCTLSLEVYYRYRADGTPERRGPSRRVGPSETR